MALLDKNMAEELIATATLEVVGIIEAEATTLDVRFAVDRTSVRVSEKVYPWCLVKLFVFVQLVDVGFPEATSDDGRLGALVVEPPAGFTAAFEDDLLAEADLLEDTGWLDETASFEETALLDEGALAEDVGIVFKD